MIWVVGAEEKQQFTEAPDFENRGSVFWGFQVLINDERENDRLLP